MKCPTCGSEVKAAVEITSTSHTGDDYKHLIDKLDELEKAQELPLDEFRVILNDHWIEMI